MPRGGSFINRRRGPAKGRATKFGHPVVQTSTKHSWTKEQGFGRQLRALGLEVKKLVEDRGHTLAVCRPAADSKVLTARMGALLTEVGDLRVYKEWFVRADGGLVVAFVLDFPTTAMAAVAAAVNATIGLHGRMPTTIPIADDPSRHVTDPNKAGAHPSDYRG